MFDAISPSDLARPIAGTGTPQRARGRAYVSFDGAAGGSGLRILRQEGSAKVRLPKVAAGEPPEIVMMNTAGGVTGGDHFRWEIELESGASATVTTPASERIYRSISGNARIETVLRVGDGCALEWLPQETILFDRGRLDRRLIVSLAEDARLLAIEAVLIGRVAHGETVRSGFLRDRWHLSRNGRLLFADVTRIENDIARQVAAPAVLAGNTAYATLIYAAPDAEAKRDLLRETLADTPDFGASVRDGLLIARAVAADGFALRHVLVPALAVLREGRPLPRVWTC